jgi:CIC family chloride channel protein
MYRSQVRSEAESPAHRGEYSVPLLQKLFVRDAMTKKVITVNTDTCLAEVAKAMTENGIKGMPVVDGTGKLIGVVTLTDILKVDEDQREKKTVGEVMTKELVVIDPNENLYVAFQKMTGNQIGRLPVVDPADNRKLIGLITRGDIGRIYNIEIQSRLKETGSLV